uniref:Uncharacterized protein n=1 Tax=Lotus japonicus TaxID=34305 RepID=I3SZB9_LOTJA|nr:unknown [Lotus japonicus]
MLLNRNKENRSFIILSSSNCFQMGPFNNVKYHNGIKEEINQFKRNHKIPIKISLGPLGVAPQIANFFSFYHLITHNKISSIKKNLQLNKFKKLFK